jgi:hypothetical protein
MSDISKRGGSDDCEGEGGERGERGERGKRGKRGHDGHDGAAGPTGPTGPTGSTGLTGPTGPQAATFGALLKFSGRAAGVDSESGTDGISFLPDSGFGFSVSPIFTPEDYPVAVAHNVRNMAVNLVGFVVPQGGQVIVDLLLDGAVVPGFTIPFIFGDPSLKTILAGPALFAIGQVFNVRVTTKGTVTETVNTSVTIGVE